MFAWIIIQVGFSAYASTNTNTAVTVEQPDVPVHSLIKVGDSYEQVLKLMGEPQVDCPLKGGKRVLFYDLGEVHFSDNCVMSFTFQSEEQLQKKKDARQKAAQETQKRFDALKEAKQNHPEYRRKEDNEKPPDEILDLILARKNEAYNEVLDAWDDSVSQAKVHLGAFSDDIKRRERRLFTSLIVSDLDDHYLIGDEIMARSSRKTSISGLAVAYNNWVESYLKFCDWYEAYIIASEDYDAFIAKQKRDR